MRYIIALVIAALLAAQAYTYSLAAARDDADAQIQARDAIIEAQAHTIAAQARQIRNLEGTVRDNLRTIEHLLGGRQISEQPSRGGVIRRLMTVTAYTAGPESTGKRPDHPAYGVTSSGYKLSESDALLVVAADPKYYPFGTRMRIVVDGKEYPVVVLDTGEDIKGPFRLDWFVGMENVDLANAIGRQKMLVIVDGILPVKHE